MDIGKHFTAGIQIWKNNLATLAIAGFVGALISCFSLGLLGGNMMAGMWFIALKAERGERPEIGDLFRGFDNFVNPFLYGLAFIALSLVGSMVAIGGIVVTGLFIWGFPLIVERKMEFSAAFQGSLDLAKKDYASAILIPFLGALASFVGVLGCGIGLIVTLPLAMTINASLYRELTGSAGSAAPMAPMAPMAPPPPPVPPAM